MLVIHILPDVAVNIWVAVRLMLWLFVSSKQQRTCNQFDIMATYNYLYPSVAKLQAPLYNYRCTQVVRGHPLYYYSYLSHAVLLCPTILYNFTFHLHYSKDSQFSDVLVALDYFL